MLTRALTDCAQRGLIDPAEVPWLVRLPARRAAPSLRARVRRPAADRAMREYQQQAVELGFLHDRYLRGTAPPTSPSAGPPWSSGCTRCAPTCGFPQPVRAGRWGASR